MAALWDLPDFDGHELVQFVADEESGLCALIGVHSTKLGPAAGGVRFWHYPDTDAAVADVLRLSRGMSYKNAMAGLPLGGGKAVILASADRAKPAAMLAAYGRAVQRLNGSYVTAEDVGMSVDDMVAISKETKHVAGLPAAAGAVGGDPGPHTSYGVYLGVKAAAKRALGRDSLKGLHLAIQGAGSVASGLARRAAEDGARLTIADVDHGRAEKLASETHAQLAAPENILSLDADILSPNALGAILTSETISELRVPIVAGGANNQLATSADGDRLQARGILYAPDYVINAGGIINVATEYLGDGDESLVRRRVEAIPGRLESIWEESETSGRNPAAVADGQARRLIGRA